MYLSTGRSGHHLCDLPQVDTSGQVHLSRVDLQDVETSLLIWWRELYLAIDATGSEQGRVQDVDAVGGHDNLDVLGGLEAVQLVEKFEHGALHFGISAAAGLDAGRPDGVNLVHEDDGGGVLASHDEQLSNHPRPFSDELLDQLGSGDPDEGALGVVSDGASKESLSSARRSVQQDTLGLCDAQGVKEFRVFDRQLDDLLDLLNLFGQAADHLVGRVRNFLDHHERHLKMEM